MRRAWFYLLLIATAALAACSSVPRQSASTWHGSSGAYRTAPRTLPPGLPHFVDHSDGEEEISIQAMSLVGVPYRWGGNTPQSGFDCSGLVRYVVARAADVDLPRTTAEMSTRGTSIAPDEVAPGDLIFFDTDGGRPHSHVGIYVGKLAFVDAPSTGGRVRIDYLSNPYWARHFDGIRRVASARRKSAPFEAPTLLAAPEPNRAPPLADIPPPTDTATAGGDYPTHDMGDMAPTNTPSTINTIGTPGTAAAAPLRPVTPQSAPPDAYEPPPPATIARAQAAQHDATSGTTEQGAPIVDAEPAEPTAPTSPAPAATTSSAATGPSATSDPIAKFASSNY